MNENDFEQFANSIGTLAELHNKKLSPLLSKAYFKAIASFTIEEVTNAVERAILELKFFPKPVELIEFITGKGGDLADIAEVEASKVINAMRDIGAYSTVVFDDPVTMAVIKQGFGGWIKLCADSMEADNKWFRIEFVKLYKAYANRNVKDYGKLIGIHEDTNIQGNRLDCVPEPKFIGDRKRAGQVLAGGHGKVLPFVPKKQIIQGEIDGKNQTRTGI